MWPLFFCRIRHRLEYRDRAAEAPLCCRRKVECCLHSNDCGPAVAARTCQHGARGGPFQQSAGLPLLVNTLLWLVDLHLMSTTVSRDTNMISSLRIDGSALSGLGLALSSLAGNRPNSRYAHLFLYSIVACFLVVLPSHNIDQSCLQAQIFESIQKSALLWCVCTIVAAVVLTRQHTTPVDTV